FRFPEEQYESNLRVTNDQKLVGVAFYSGRSIDYHLFIDDETWLPRARPYYIFVKEGSSFADVRKKIIQNMAIKADQIKSGHVYFYFIDQGQSQVVEIEQDCTEKVSFANNTDDDFFINSNTFIGVNWRRRPKLPKRDNLPVAEL
ncbi:uncharacterized protein LOC142356571, partial [Convolutriloba macropyga]|uniref:uncharacterized protein LOC142356571 n=1 Tax=Convolutriloba macropyga TaxID=536237 RepID=UPI003F5264C9